MRIIYFEAPGYSTTRTLARIAAVYYHVVIRRNYEQEHLFQNTLCSISLASTTCSAQFAQITSPIVITYDYSVPN